jgi:tRNA(Arg) A34 adenosine deaminase TadA
MEKDAIYMKRAIELAQQNALSAHGGPFGAVIVRDGNVISEASNSVTPDNDPTAHAEVNAIRKACKNLNTFDLSGATLYTSCEPCPMCLSAAYWARVDRIVFGANREDAARAGFSDDFIYKELSLDLEKRSIPIESILEKESQEPFETWISNLDKTPY